MAAVKVAKTVKVAKADIRKDLPVAIKGGTSAKPVWTIGGVDYRFVGSLNKFGLQADGAKPRLTPKRVLAKYEAATTSHTVKGGVLWFVGVFVKAG